MDFKRELRETIEKLGSPGKLAEESFLHYSNNYAVLKKSESLKYLIPGKIYSFYYDSQLKDEKSYINRRPIIFLDGKEITQEKNIIRGFDLVLLTPRDKTNFFVRLNAIFGKALDENDKRDPDSQMPLRFDKQILETLMGGIRYNHAYKGYKIEKIKGLIEVPREEWKYLIYLDTKSLEGANLNDIYNKYR
jgi:hypothetical protein